VRTKTTPTGVFVFIFLLAATIWGVSLGQDLLFKDGFEDPVILKVATFNTYYAFHGSLIDDKYVANPANVATTIDKFNELQIDLAGLQELQDYAALETLAAGTGMGLSAGKTSVRYRFPTAVFSRLPIVSRAWYSGPRIVSEAGIRLPDGTIAYVFSIHQEPVPAIKVGVAVNSEIIRRRAGGHPVIVVGDMNGATDWLIELSRGALQLIHNVDIDAIFATPHFQTEGEGENHGTLGFSDHPLVVADVRYTPGSAAQAATPSLEHTMPPGSVWNVGSALVPNTLVLTAITITRLPEKGTLKLGEVGVSLDQTIPAASIHGLVYETGPDSIGKDYWTFTIVENPSPAVQVPRWVDVFIQTRISNLRYANQEPDVHPDSNAGMGFVDLAYANVGVPIYAHDDKAHTDYDLFNENLPDELKGTLFIRNGGRETTKWPNEYMYFDLDESAQVYIALGHRQDGWERALPPGWTRNWADVSFNAGNARPNDIFTRCLDAGEVLIWGNHTFGSGDENQVVFIGGSCEDPQPGCDNLGIDGLDMPFGTWAVEARDCGREDCSDGRWHSWDGKQWCRALIVEEFSDWTIGADYGQPSFYFWTDWGAWDYNDCGDGVTTIRIPICGLEVEVTRDGGEQQHYCNISGSSGTVTIEKDHDSCEYVIIGNPYFN